MTTPEPTWTVEQACTDTQHAYYGRVTGDPIHGATGSCECGLRLFTLDGREIET